MLRKIKHKPAAVVILFSEEIPYSPREIIASDTGFYLAEARGQADDDAVYVKQWCHYATLQIPTVVASDGGKYRLRFLEAKERLTVATHIKFLKR